MLEKCLCGKTHNANESLNVMIWNCVLKATLIRLDMLFVGVYDAMAHFNNDETVALDNMELLKIDPGYYITKCCRSFRMYRKRSSIYRMMEPKKKKTSEGAGSFQTKARTLKLKQPQMKW